MKKALYCSCALTILLAFSLTERAFAGAFDTFGAGSRGIAMGNAQVAAVEDYTAPVYNPAALPYIRELIGLKARDQLLVNGYSFISHKLFLNGEDQGLEDIGALNVGTIIPINKRITAGITIFLPPDKMMVQKIRPDSIPRYEFYDARYLVPAFNIGIGVKVFKWLSVGLGVYPTFNINTSEINMDLDSTIASVMGSKLAEPKTGINPSAQIEAIGGNAFGFGIHARPFKNLRLGFLFKQKQLSESFIRVKLISSLLPESAMEMHGISGFNAASYTFGFAYDPVDKLTIAFDYSFQKWSEFESGNEITSTDPNFTTPRSEFNAKDIWVPRVGIEFHDDLNIGFIRNGRYAIRAGYFFWESPLPPAGTGAVKPWNRIDKNQVIPNLIDNDTHSISGGFGFKFPIGKIKMFSIDFHAQYLLLEEREHIDLERNPAVIVSEGSVTNIGTVIMLLI